ncbi:MAG TPA: ATPase, T2SS/T4P/T4SS family [Solirubrobacteraceae bacterium]|nr:ATPase, T2SS/T4P/T4SS family [Solirubrobacteraceae bacterium]
MSTGLDAEAAPRAEDAAGYPRGLIPPAHRGRSQRLIGDVIVDLGFARREAVEAAVAVAREQGRSTGAVMIENGTLRYDQLARALAERLGLDYIDLSIFDIDMGAVSLIDPDIAKRHQAVPVGFMPDGSLLLAMADPTNVLTFDEFSMITGKEIKAAAAAKEDILALITRVNRLEETVTEVKDSDAEELEIALQQGPTADAPIVKLVYSIIAQAVEQGASDIHCDPEDGEMQVLFRIDGVLSPAATIARSMAPSVVSRVKIMASLDISERRVPQDGRLAVTIEGRRVDVRVVSLPLVGGEGIVMRILDAGAVVRDLDSLGMQDVERKRFLASIRKPYGAVLVTGPTGSGKSTTLYSALGMVNDGKRSVLTIEDPVESPIPGVKQMQVSTKTGVTFAAGLRSMLRADPDVIMVGEIRDAETAEIAIQAALTGHMVMSTLHTRDAASAITRLIDMGIEPFMLAAAIDCVVAQRLARTLCPQCRRPSKLTPEMLKQHGMEGAHVFEPAGCIRCRNTGYSGRVGLYEVMPINEEIRNLLLGRRAVGEIAAAATRNGMRTMRSDGLDKVKQGLTSFAEVARVTTTF